MSHDDRPSAIRTLYAFARQALPLERETALFVLASTLDVMMTKYLLENGPPDGRTWFVESNPIPRYFLYSWGIRALVYFKFSVVAFIALICQVIARKKVEVARRVLNFASLLVMAVVVYSVVLWMQHV